MLPEPGLLLSKEEWERILHSNCERSLGGQGVEEHSKKREQHVQKHKVVNFQGMFEDLEGC